MSTTQLLLFGAVTTALSLALHAYVTHRLLAGARLAARPRRLVWLFAGQLALLMPLVFRLMPYTGEVWAALLQRAGWVPWGVSSLVFVLLLAADLLLLALLGVVTLAATCSPSRAPLPSSLPLSGSSPHTSSRARFPSRPGPCPNILTAGSAAAHRTAPHSPSPPNSHFKTLNRARVARSCAVHAGSRADLRAPPPPRRPAHCSEIEALATTLNRRLLLTVLPAALILAACAVDNQESARSTLPGARTFDSLPFGPRGSHP